MLADSNLTDSFTSKLVGLAPDSSTSTPYLDLHLENSNEFIKKIQTDKNFKLINFLNKEITPKLNDNRDPFIKKNCIEALAVVLGKTRNLKKSPWSSSSNLSADNLDFLLNFLQYRIINDTHIIWPGLLECIYQIFLRKELEKIVQIEQYSITLTTLIDHIHAQSLENRLILFKLMMLLIKKHPCTAKKLGSNFIEKYINLIDEEKDPDTLKCIWNLSILINRIGVNLGPLAEDFHDVCSMYWPIEFKSGATGQNSEKKLSLKNLLEELLTSSALFIPFNFTIILEKLGADGITPKLSALQLFTLECKKYPEIAYSNRVKEDDIEKAIFSCIKMGLSDHCNGNDEADALDPNMMKNKGRIHVI